MIMIIGSKFLSLAQSKRIFLIHWIWTVNRYCELFSYQAKFPTVSL